MKTSEYLHYFIGQKCKITNASANYSGWLGVHIMEPGHINYVKEGLIYLKPILNNLFDITEEHATALANLGYNGQKYGVNRVIIYAQHPQENAYPATIKWDSNKNHAFFISIKEPVLSPAQLHYLVKNGYWPNFYPDAFENGDIIDAKTISQ